MQEPSDNPGRDSRWDSDTLLLKTLPLRLSGIYFLVGALWTLGSDRLIDVLVDNSSQLTYLQNIKGCFYVFLTTCLLYWLLKFSTHNLLIAESELQATLESTVEGICVIDTRGTIVSYNQQFLHLWQIPEAVIATRDRDKVLAFILPQLQQPDRFHTIMREFDSQTEAGNSKVLKLLTGKIFECCSNPPWVHDKSVGQVWSFHDITKQQIDLCDRIRAENEVRRLNAALEERVAQRTAELESLIDAIPDYIFVIERADMRIPFCNQQFAQQIGFENRHQVQGKTIFECFADSEATHFAQQNAQVFELGQPLYVQETIVLPDGPHDFETFKIPLRRSTTGEVYALLGVSHDHTLLIETQRALTQRTIQLEASNRELDAFSYSVSHDLQAPLRHISGFVGALKLCLEQNGSLTNAEVAHYIQVIQDSSQKMSLLINGLLTLSQIGRRSLVTLPVDLNHLVADTIAQISEQASPDAQATDTLPETEFVIGDLPTVMGDVTLLRQVFSNLLDNAIKFSRGRHPARIEVGALPDRTLFVRDNGVGFAMNGADQLFSAFQRLHSPLEFEGTGVGLAIVQRIVHRHNGKIWAESQPDQGACFFFELSKL